MLKPGRKKTKHKLHLSPIQKDMISPRRQMQEKQRQWSEENKLILPSMVSMSGLYGSYLQEGEIYRIRGLRRLFNQPPPADLWEQWTKTKYWLHWSPELGMHCQVCNKHGVTGKLNMLGTGVKDSELFYRNNGWQMILRHDGSTKEKGYTGRQHDQAFKMEAKEILRKRKAQGDEGRPGMPEGGDGQAQPLQPASQPPAAVLAAEGDGGQAEHRQPVSHTEAIKLDEDRNQRLVWLQGLYSGFDLKARGGHGALKGPPYKPLPPPSPP
jgi:hypothetical protein